MGYRNRVESLGDHLHCDRSLFTRNVRLNKRGKARTVISGYSDLCHTSLIEENGEKKGKMLSVYGSSLISFDVHERKKEKIELLGITPSYLKKVGKYIWIRVNG